MKLHATTIPAQVTALSAWYCLSSQQAFVTTQHSRNAGGDKPSAQNLTKLIFAGIAVCKCLAHCIIVCCPTCSCLKRDRSVQRPISPRLNRASLQAISSRPWTALSNDLTVVEVWLAPAAVHSTAMHCAMLCCAVLPTWLSCPAAKRAAKSASKDALLA